MQTRIITELKEGLILDIFEDYQDEIGYQGKARLLNRVRYGDSFFLSDEDIRPIDDKSYSKKDDETRLKYNKLINFFFGNDKNKPNHKCKQLYTELVKMRRDNINNFNKMFEYLDGLRAKNKAVTNNLHNIFKEFDNWYIVRFIHQHERKNWHNSIFHYERWNVQFIEDHTGWKDDFITTRNIRILKCVNPKERMRGNEMIEFTTYDHGVSSKEHRMIDRSYSKVKNKTKDKWSDTVFQFEFDDIIND